MAVNPLVVKTAIAAASDKRTWIIVGSIIVGVVFFIVAVCAAFIGLFSFDNGIIGEVPQEYTEFISNMQQCYSRLDINIAEFNNEIQDGQLDTDQIHAVFYTLYFAENRNLTDEFFRQFTECFIERSSADDGYTVTVSTIESAYSRLEVLTGSTITQNHRRQIDELRSVMIYSGIRTNSVGIVPNIEGASAEAYDDITFRQLMSEAEKYIGYPYVWGGSNPATSFDCSGFICWVYTKSGVYNLPRTTAQGIYNQTIRITASEAKPGDLVFFTRTYNSADTVTHLGIYVGDGKMLHCGNPIQYTSINTDFWQSKFYGFGRLQ